MTGSAAAELGFSQEDHTVPDILDKSKALSFLRFLSHEDVARVHEETLTILASTGIRVTHEGCRAMLAEAGAEVDPHTPAVRIPPELAEDSMETVPNQILLAGRDPNRDITLRATRVYARNGGGPGHIVDMDTGAVREITTADLANYVRLVDSLEHLDYVAPVYPQDTPSSTRDIRALATMLSNTTKHANMRILDKQSLPYVIKMATIVAGGEQQLRQRPPLTILESPISPLKIPDVLVEVLTTCGECGIPVEICSMPNVGATGPITLAGSLLIANVEMVASTVISQVAHPGAPIIFAPRIVLMDMATTRTLTGTMECALLATACVQMARECYSIPVSVHGPYADSVIPDAQSAIERTYFTLLPALAGANVLAGAGHLEQGLVISLAQLAIDNEIHGIVGRALEGFEVDDHTLAVDAIHQSLNEGEFLTSDHTLEHLRKVRRHTPDLFARDTRAAWVAAGSQDLLARAKRRVADLLDQYQPTREDEDVAKNLDEVITQATAELELD